MPGIPRIGRATSFKQLVKRYTTKAFKRWMHCVVSITRREKAGKAHTFDRPLKDRKRTLMTSEMTYLMWNLCWKLQNSGKKKRTAKKSQDENDPYFSSTDIKKV